MKQNLQKQISYILGSSIKNKGMGLRTMKKTIMLLTLLVMTAMPVTAYADMQLRDIRASYIEDGEWKEINTQHLHKSGLADGWYEENGDMFYIVNGYVTSSLQTIDGKKYLFKEDGRLIKADSVEYAEYFNLLKQMNEAKSLKDADWSYDCRNMSDYERIDLLQVYCQLYIPGTVDIGQAGFKYIDGMLMIDTANPDIGLEGLVKQFYQQLDGLENLDDEGKVRKIHDVIVRTFDYDYTLENHSDDLKVAFENNNKIVCSGYAGIFNNICKYYSLESEVIEGYGNGELHAWNRVKVDGKWKYVDCCWDDTGNTDMWLLKSKREFDYTHKPH